MVPLGGFFVYVFNKEILVDFLKNLWYNIYVRKNTLKMRKENYYAGLWC